MVQIINDLQALPKQEFTVVLENTLWDITIIEAAGCMAVSIVRGGEPTAVISGWRAVTGQLIIPRDREAALGNFAFLTVQDDLPWWEQFGISQSLVYVTAAELAAVRNGN